MGVVGSWVGVVGSWVGVVGSWVGVVGSWVDVVGSWVGVVGSWVGVVGSWVGVVGSWVGVVGSWVGVVGSGSHPVPTRKQFNLKFTAWTWRRQESGVNLFYSRGPAEGLAPGPLASSIHHILFVVPCADCVTFLTGSACFIVGTFQPGLSCAPREIVLFRTEG